MTIADVYVFDDALVPNAIQGADVTLLDPNTSAVVAFTATNSNGKAGFSVPDGTYEVRIFKRGYGSGVHRLVVDALATTNKFDAAVEDLTALPVSPDSRLCRCTGRFVNLDGRPTKGVTFKLQAKVPYGGQIPKIVDGDLVFADGMALRSDAQGLVSVDLFRTGQYHAIFAGEDDTTWCIEVPDRSSVNLIDLLFPAPVLLRWDQTAAPADAVTLAVNETKAVPVSLLFSNFQTKTRLINEWVAFTNSDGGVVDLSYSDSSGEVFLRGIVAGNATVRANLQPHLSPFRVPPYALTANPLQVTVTP